MIHSIFLAYLSDMTIFFSELRPSFLWPASRSYTFHFIIHAFFTQSFSPFLKLCPYHLSLCRCIFISSIPSLFLYSLQENLSVTLMPNIRLIILISARWSSTQFSFFTGHVSLPYNIQLCSMHTTSVKFPSQMKGDILVGKQMHKLVD